MPTSTRVRAARSSINSVGNGHSRHTLDDDFPIYGDGSSGARKYESYHLDHSKLPAGIGFLLLREYVKDIVVGNGNNPYKAFTLKGIAGGVQDRYEAMRATAQAYQAEVIPSDGWFGLKVFGKTNSKRHLAVVPDSAIQSNGDGTSTILHKPKTWHRRGLKQIAATGLLLYGGVRACSAATSSHSSVSNIPAATANANTNGINVFGGPAAPVSRAPETTIAPVAAATNPNPTIFNLGYAANKSTLSYTENGAAVTVVCDAIASFKRPAGQTLPYVDLHGTNDLIDYAESATGGNTDPAITHSLPFRNAMFAQVTTNAIQVGPDHPLLDETSPGGKVQVRVGCHR